MADATSKYIEDAGKTPGLMIWRIENFQLVPQPKNQYGNFFTGDSYILLNTIELKRNYFRYDLHFWLGDESSQDERGTAAILAVTIDDKLGGDPVQYRELQGSESVTFMGYFKNGIKYQKGGIRSGFSHAKTNMSEIKRVLHIKGRRSVRATEVAMSWSSFNHGDCFIVEINNNIYQWLGSSCNQMEKLKSCQMANSIKNDEKAGKGKLYVLDDQGDATEYPKELLEHLSGTPADVAEATKDDVPTISQSNQGKSTLYRVSSDTGTLIVEEIETSPFNQGSLDSGDCFIVDTGSGNTIFVWKGKKASKDERSGAFSNASKFIETKGYLPHTKIQVIAETAEPVLFTQYFCDWKKRDQAVGFGKTYTINKVAKVEQIRVEMGKFHETPKLAAKHGMVDDGSGDVKVWRIEGNQKIPVDHSKYGTFFTGDSYIILYTYRPKRREEYIIYFWQGNSSTIDEVATSAYLATQLDDEYGQRPVQIRVVQGKEPLHFLSIFNNTMVITKGGYSKAEGKEVGLSTNALYQVRSTKYGGTKAIEVKASAASLNSNDAFILKTPQKSYLWIGIGASKIEIEAAQQLLDRVGANSNTLEEIKENSEPADFWKILGGKQDYANDPRFYDDLDENPPRLFAISNAKGCVMVEEVPGEFAQSDLEVDDVMMLDIWSEIYLWIGKGANAEEKKAAPKLTADYIKSDPRGRDQGCPIITVKMGNEPITFKGFFPSWDNSYFEKNCDLDARIAQLKLN